MLIRPLQRSDRNDLIRGFEKLSMCSRRFRFLTPTRKLSEYQLKSLIEVDQLNHVAVAVKDIGRLGKPGIAIGRFVRLEDEPTIAEFAITVSDEYQNRGIGKLLTRLLESFGARIKRETGNVLQADLPVVTAAAEDETSHPT